MDRQALIDFALELSGAYPDFPFGEETLCIKANGKIFLLFVTDKRGVAYCNLKCDPDMVRLLSETRRGVIPGYHMNKKHWISLLEDTDLTPDEQKQLVLEAYRLVNKVSAHGH